MTKRGQTNVYMPLQCMYQKNKTEQFKPRQKRGWFKMPNKV